MNNTFSLKCIVFRYCANAAYVMKIDDDVTINFETVFATLENKEQLKNKNYINVFIKYLWGEYQTYPHLRYRYKMLRHKTYLLHPVSPQNVSVFMNL